MLARRRLVQGRREGGERPAGSPAACWWYPLAAKLHFSRPSTCASSQESAPGPSSGCGAQASRRSASWLRSRTPTCAACCPARRAACCETGHEALIRAAWSSRWSGSLRATRRRSSRTSATVTCCTPSCAGCPNGSPIPLRSRRGGPDDHDEGPVSGLRDPQPVDDACRRGRRRTDDRRRRRDLLDRALRDRAGPLRLVGVAVSNIEPFRQLALTAP